MGEEVGLVLLTIIPCDWALIILLFTKQKIVTLIAQPYPADLPRVIAGDASSAVSILDPPPHPPPPIPFTLACSRHPFGRAR